MPPDPKRVQAVFLAAVECREPAARAAVLDAECSGDAKLRRRVEDLLSAHDQFDESLEVPLAGFRPGSAPSIEPERQDRQGPRDDTFGGAAGAPDLTSGSESDLTMAAGAAGAATERAHRAAPIIEGYEVLGELGRGGMGVVYRGRQIRLNRPCVLKMILAGVHADDDSVARFLAEAEAVARLQHPHIVQIHHIGEADGLPFFELEYVDGGSLDRRLDGAPWPARRAAELIEAVARGVAEAHRRGIIHRDLKPGNVLLAADGKPKITDFGLAKALDKDSGLTRTDSVMGSPGYMSPEQAAGKTRQVGPLADIYSLGAILYELLTGGAPFRGTTALEIIEQVRHAEPVPPSRLVPALPRDIETIALKCLQKEPGKRYDSAVAMAEDLRRFLAGEPIVARPIPIWERSWRWCRRHPTPAILTAAVILVATLGLAGIIWQWNEAVKARDLAARRAVAEASARREAEATVVDMYTTSGIQAGDQEEHARAALWFANAARRARDDPDRRLANAIRARTWGRRAFMPRRAIVADGSWPGRLMFHPDGRYLITKAIIDGATRDARHTLWDLDVEQSCPFPGGMNDAPAAAWSPNGRALAVGRPDGDVIVTRFPEGDGAGRIRFPGRIRLLTYGADGRFLAIAGGNSARVWDARAGAFATPELVHPADVTSLALDPTGRYLATGCRDQQARLFAVPGDSAGPLWPPVPHIHAKSLGIWDNWNCFCAPPVFVDGGRGLITYGGKGGLAWRAVETGMEVRTLDSPELSGRIAAIELSPDGRYLAVFGRVLPATIRVFEMATGRPLGPLLVHQNTIYGATFSPDGRMLLSCSSDNTAKLWAIPSGQPLARPIGLHRAIHIVAFTPQGRSLATQDGELVRLWALPEEGVPMTKVPVGANSFAALSPDGALAIPTGMTFANNRGPRRIRTSRVATGRPAGPPLRPGGVIVDAAFSPDGQSVATVGAGPSGKGQEVVVWDWAGGRPVWRAPLPSEARSLSYRPDGRRLAVLCGGGELLVFDHYNGREAFRWRAHDAEQVMHWINNGKIRFSPDGRGVLTWGMGNDVRVWDADTGHLRYPPLRHRDKCHDLQFSPDGRSMVLASYDGSVRVRDLATGTVLADLPQHPDIVYSAGFSPDGRLLVTACRDHTVRVWDWRAGRLACPPFEHAKEVLAATFTPDGRWVVAVSDDGIARAWDWRGGKPITPPLSIGGGPRTVAVTPDGQHAVVGGDLDALVVLDLGALAPDADVDPDFLYLRAELLSGQRFHEGGGTVNLSAEEWVKRWRAYRRQSSVETRSPSSETIHPQPASGSAPMAAEGSFHVGIGAPAVVEIRLEDLVARFDEAADWLGRGRVAEASATSRALAPALRRGVEERPDEPRLRHWLALALVLAGDRQGYQRACTETLDWFGQDDHHLIGEAARACLIESDAVADLSDPQRLIETALSREPKTPWIHYEAGLAAFRAGRFDRAVECAMKSIDLGAGWEAAPLNYPVLAMAYHRLDHRAEARRWLDVAHGRVGHSVRGLPSVDHFDSSGMWWDRVEFQLLLREADAIVFDAAFPADPFAP
jgi:eukaryotic-like serine/threonine-protein kinase